MKNILYLLSCAVFVLIGCVQMEDDLFDEVPSKRQENLSNEAKQILTSAQNGWIMSYYADIKRYGGFNLYLTFTEEAVTASSELAPNQSETSLYSYKFDDSATLSFDMFNSVIHEFSDPKSDGKGYGGDFEFAFVKVNPDEIVLRGKKTGNIIVMHPLPDGTDWKTYVGKVQDMMDFLKYSIFVLKAPGTSIEFAETGIGKILSYSSEGVNANKRPYIYTDKGLTFYKPMEWGGRKVQHFVLSEEGVRLNCIDKDASEMYITQGDVYKYYIGKLATTGVSTDSSEWLLEDKEGMSADIRALYERIAASAKLQKQSLESIGFGYFGKRKSYGVCFHVSGASLYYNTERTDDTEARTISFKYTGKTNGSLFYEQVDGVKEMLTLLGTTYSISDYGINFGKVKMTSTLNSQVYFDVDLKAK